MQQKILLVYKGDDGDGLALVVRFSLKDVNLELFK